MTPHIYCTHDEGEPCDCREQLHTASQSKSGPREGGCRNCGGQIASTPNDKRCAPHRRRDGQPWPVLGPGSLPLREIAGRDLTGYTPARHNGHHWISEWIYAKNWWRGWSYCDGNQATDRKTRQRRACGCGCPSLYRLPAPPPPAGGTA